MIPLRSAPSGRLIGGPPETERYAAAEPELTRTITLYADLDDRRGADLDEILLGSTAARQGNTDLALPLLQQALADLESLTPPDPLNVARAKVFLGKPSPSPASTTSRPAASTSPCRNSHTSATTTGRPTPPSTSGRPPNVAGCPRSKPTGTPPARTSTGT
ncbi:hypothetical protein [Streptomyces sp. LS1784]|uniref:hypothetical protein n=1 Tax=Streptomyces sp. LS1784 TaxID=2851533 RepID=UPI001CCE3682|nr:hypothetical protein [Streptomyces sp. LS1784]